MAEVSTCHGARVTVEGNTTRHYACTFCGQPCDAVAQAPAPGPPSAAGAGLHEFNPDWTLAPAAMLREWLSETHLSVPVFAVACAGRARKDWAVALITEVMDRKPLTELHAQVLAKGTGIYARMWLAMEARYRADLAAGRTDTTPEDGDG